MSLTLVRILKRVEVTEPRFYREEQDRVFLPTGEYSVVRDFDEDRYLILIDNKYTLVKKSLTRDIA